MGTASVALMRGGLAPLMGAEFRIWARELMLCSYGQLALYKARTRGTFLGGDVGGGLEGLAEPATSPYRCVSFLTRFPFPNSFYINVS